MDIQFKSGMLMDYAGTNIPKGWVVCDGHEESRMGEPNLFAAIGVIWGKGDGQTTFNVPNFQRCVAVGSGGVVHNPILGNTVGSHGGAELDSTLIAHSHGAGSYQVAVGGPQGGGKQVAQIQAMGGTQDHVSVAGESAVAGQGSSINIIQPSNVVMKIIKL